MVLAEESCAQGILSVRIATDARNTVPVFLSVMGRVVGDHVTMENRKRGEDLKNWGRWGRL
jgi:hypothetical protein